MKKGLSSFKSRQNQKFKKNNFVIRNFVYTPLQRQNKNCVYIFII